MLEVFDNKFTSQESILNEKIIPCIEAFHHEQLKSIQELTSKIIDSAKNYKTKNPFEKLIHEYDLSSKEGVVLMCLAEALLRIPDNQTIDDLIEDKIPSGKWKDHISNQKDLFVNISSIAFMFSGKIVERSEDHQSIFHNLLKQMSEPVLRSAIKQGINILAKQFVFDQNIQQANHRAQQWPDTRYSFSFDMLGEAALTYIDAERYYQSYKEAILATAIDNSKGNSVSIKISALYPRYERNKLDACMKELLPKIISLVVLAQEHKVDICLDAEEADRLNLSLILIEKLFEQKILSEEYKGFGLAVQAYQKRAGNVIRYLNTITLKYQRKINIRLVKGAYWDTEIKLAQELGVEDYPVFTKKFLTDLNYLYCAHLLHQSDYIFPQFATHNAFSIAYITQLFSDKPYEFQKLHGMGDEIYSYFDKQPNFRCRVYAPVGGYNDLLPYLVRRLLENGANTSFIHQLKKGGKTQEELIQSPLDKINQIKNIEIPKPIDIFQPDRLNSKGTDFSEEKVIHQYSQEIKNYKNKASSLVEGIEHPSSNYLPIYKPYANEELIGEVSFANQTTVLQALEALTAYSSIWKNTAIEERTQIIEQFADQLEFHTHELVYLCAIEAGKTYKDGIADIREAVDFCRYYAHQAKLLFTKKILPGPTGELNELHIKGKGLSLVISPWNFPVAIFVGQLVANLVCGNVTIAKPAEQTSLIAFHVFKLLLKAGLPPQASSLLLGKGEDICPPILRHPSLENVVFTGSLETAKIIQGQLLRQNKIVNLIAETGGLNCLISDSSALTEHVVRDVIISSFNSAGQRCSACRILCLEENIYKKTITMLKGALDCLVIGDPTHLSTDVASVIDQVAFNKIKNHIKKFNNFYQSPGELPNAGYFIKPTIIEIGSLQDVSEEIFGPVLHVVSYRSSNLKKLCEDINQLGYGLTLGIHSRIDHTINTVINTCSVGNIYVNRNIVGAVVGAQPFGGQGLSGTGPKAGGPHYLSRLCHEYSVSNNTTAMGGNATLLTNLSE